MNNVRRLIPLSHPLRTFSVKRFYCNPNNLTEEENQKLYKKLLGKSHSEQMLETSSFAQWITPAHDFGPPRLLTYDWSAKSIFSWLKRKRIEFNKLNQRYSAERVKVLGSDLAAAHFTVFRGGAVRFRDQEDFIKWTNKREDYNVKLPHTYKPDYFVEAIDISNLIFYYEAFENFKNLYKLKWLRVRNNPILDNWCIDYISHTIPNLEYLDISSCPQVTAAGICGLQRLRKLKILETNSTDVEVQMACYILEDVIPGLYVSIQDKVADEKLLLEEKKFSIHEIQ